MDVAIQISKNLVKGEPISSTGELLRLAQNKKSIYHSVFGIKPASFIINMNFYQVIRMIEENRLHTTIRLVKLKTNK